MGISTGAAALGAGLAGIFGGGGNANPPQQFQLPNMGQAAGSALGGIGGLSQYNTAGQVLPQAGGITQNLVNNPYAGQLQSGAGTAGQLGQQAGLNAFGAGGGLYGAGNQVLNTAMDPQQALYNQTLAQVTQQQNVQNANAGVGSSPYGAGLTDMNINNFNIDWQNQQLQRQIAGLGAAGSAYGQGANLQQGGVGTYLEGAGLPYSTFNQIGNNQIGALSQYGQMGQQAAAIPTTQNQQYLSYLGQGAQQQAVNNQTAMDQYQQNLGYGSLAAGGLGALGAGTGLGWTNYFGGGGASSGANNPLYASGV